MNGESVLSEWLARLQQGRVWRRQAEEFDSWSQLAGEDLLRLVSEAAPGERPSERDICLLLGINSPLAQANGYSLAGVGQRFNSLYQRGKHRLTSTAPMLSKADGAFQGESDNLWETAAADLSEVGAELLPDLDSPDAIWSEDLSDDTAALSLVLSGRKAHKVAAAESKLGMERKSEIKIKSSVEPKVKMNSQTETANKVETTGEDIVSASWPELVFSADLLKSAENEPVQPLTAAEASAERLTEISADIPVHLTSARSEVLNTPGVEPEPLATGADVDMLTDLVAERLREDIEALLGSASLI